MGILKLIIIGEKYVDVHKLVREVGTQNTTKIEIDEKT
jgi:hypothetical protein